MTDYFAGDTRTNRERMLAGDPYVADDPDNEQRSRRGAQLADAYHRACRVDPVAAMPLLEALVGHLGEGAFVKPPLFVDYGEHISIGARTFANYGLVALDVAPITIGQDCQIGPNVQLLTPTHPLEAQPRRDKLEAAEPITIGDNVWIGGGAIICPGVTIGADSVIGAGAVVTKDVPPGVVAVGNPARVIKEVPGAPSTPPDSSTGLTGAPAEPAVQE
nr:sugar O-acetyltransferase [Quadrisphaera sp. INWT6]